MYSDCTDTDFDTNILELIYTISVPQNGTSNGNKY